MINDNDYSRRWFRFVNSDGESFERLIQFIPAAKTLIERYCQQNWKDDPNAVEYIACEYTLCLHMGHAEKIGRDLLIQGFAHLFDVNPMLMYNDKDLPI